MLNIVMDKKTGCKNSSNSRNSSAKNISSKSSAKNSNSNSGNNNRSAHLGKRRILIVEDEKNIAKAEGLILGDEYEIHYAVDGEEALKIAKEVYPDLVILDLMLPKRGGYDVCFHLRQDKQLRNSKIIMVTAKNQAIDRDKGLFIGADHYLTKPFDPEELRSAVRQLINR